MKTREYFLCCTFLLGSIAHAHGQSLYERAQDQRHLGQAMILVSLLGFTALGIIQAYKYRVKIYTIPPMPTRPRLPLTPLPAPLQGTCPGPDQILEKRTLIDPTIAEIRQRISESGSDRCDIVVSLENHDDGKTILSPGIALIKDTGNVKFLFNGHEWPWDKRKQLLCRELGIQRIDTRGADGNLSDCAMQ